MTLWNFFLKHSVAIFKIMVLTGTVILRCIACLEFVPLLQKAGRISPFHQWDTVDKQMNTKYISLKHTVSICLSLIILHLVGVYTVHTTVTILVMT